MMPTDSIIKSKLQNALMPEVLHIQNESHMHGGPATESHYKLTVVAQSFAGMSRVARHQKVYAILAEQLDNGVHALALHLFSPDEWQASSEKVPSSPDCAGGSN